MNGVQGKEGWRWILILEGILTIAISVLVYLFVPSFPEKTKILSGEEKAHLLETLRRDKGDQKLDLKNVNWFKTLSDYKIWFPYVFCLSLQLPANTSQYHHVHVLRYDGSVNVVFYPHDSDRTRMDERHGPSDVCANLAERHGLSSHRCCFIDAYWPALPIYTVRDNLRRCWVDHSDYLLGIP